MFRFIVLTTLLACAFGATIPQGMVPIPDGRIIGGQEADISQFPYQVSMKYSGRHRCGGSIINPSTVITAAHCVDGTVASAVTFTAGTSVQVNQDISLAVERMVKHEKYNSRTFDNDIAIVFLKGAFTLSRNGNIAAVELAGNGEYVRDGETAVVSGWGSTYEGGSGASKLQYVEVNIISRQQCATSYQNRYAITDSMLCAGVAQGGKDACQGDSGGPLVSGGKLVGVVSWGIGCARPQYPGVYANVANLREWIDAKLA